MAIPLSKIVARLRSKVDLIEEVRDVLQQDGTNYTVRLTSRPVVSGTDEVYITHTTFTTGFNQYVPRNGTQSPSYASGTNLVYEINYNRGELYFYQGSGFIIPSPDMTPFAPWNTSRVTAYYQKSRYTDTLLAEYASFAVAAVEIPLQIGMYVSGASGIAPITRSYSDNVDYFTSSPYAVDEKFVIAEDVEIIQELISLRASYNLSQRERRLGAGNAIRIKDGDTEIDTAVNQRYVRDYVMDIKTEFDELIKWVIYNMGNGYSLRQINEMQRPAMLNTSQFNGGMSDGQFFNLD